MSIDAKIRAVEVAYEAVKTKKAVAESIEASVLSLVDYTVPALVDGQFTQVPSENILIQWDSKGKTYTATVSVAELATLVSAKYTEAVAEVNKIDVDAIIAAEKAKG